MNIYKVPIKLVLFGSIFLCSTVFSNTDWGVPNRVVYKNAKKGWYGDKLNSESNMNEVTVRGNRSYKQWSSISDFDSKNYKDSIVIHGQYLGRDLHWKAKWWANADDEPGMIPDSGGTSAWKLLNTVDPTSDAQWEGCDNSPSSSAQVCLPTWQDGAKGAYSLISDDFGAFDGNDGYRQIWEIADEVASSSYEYFNDYNPLRVGFGIQVDKSDESEYEDMRKIAKMGHQILSHSYNHTSAAHQWLWFYQNDTTGDAASEIDGFTQAGGDTIPISGTCTGLDDPYIVNLVYKDKIPHVGKDLPKWASGAIIVNSAFDSICNIAGVTKKSYGGYQIAEAADGSARWLKTNAESWIISSKVAVCILDCAERGDMDPEEDLTYKYDGWSGDEWDLNIRKSKDTLDMNVWDKLREENSIPSQYWAENKSVDFYIYPYDAFSRETHDSLDASGYVGARGGSKGSTPTPLDFYHPFRTDFDAHYNDALGVYPDNPHQYLTLKTMLDSIVASNGFHTREIHTVTDDEALGWGGVKEQNFKTHMEDVLNRIKNGDITMFTPTDAVKYRITTDNMNVNIAKGNSNNWIISPEITLGSQFHEDYKDILISYVVTLPQDFTAPTGKVMVCKYVNGGEYSRRAPRKLQRRGVENTWAVYADPYKGDVEIFFDDVAIKSSEISSAQKDLAIANLKNGKLSFFAKAGQYDIKVYGINGRLLRAIKKNALKSGLITENLNLRSVSNGFLIIKINNNGKSVKKMMLNKL